jgi:thiol-disulfide isomerase/thioredoxin
MRPRHRSLVAVLALGVAGTSIGWWLAAPGAADDGKDLPFSREHLKALDDATDAIGNLQVEQGRLRERIDEYERRLDIAEQRVGLVPPKPSGLTAFGQVGARLEPADVAKMDSRGNKPRRTRLAAEVPAGAPFVVTFWATWCKPCTSPEELALSKELRASLGREGLGFVNVAIDAPAVADADPRAATWLYPYLVAKDAHLEMLPRAFVERFGVDLPLHLVVAPSGTITWFRKGALSESVLDELVTAAMAARSQ